MNTRVSPLTMACPDCDLLQRVPTLEPGTRVGCVRCGRLLMKRSSGPPDLALALTLAATIAYVVANTLPLMDLRVVGRFSSTTLIGGTYQLWIQGELGHHRSNIGQIAVVIQRAFGQEKGLVTER